MIAFDDCAVAARAAYQREVDAAIAIVAEDLTRDALMYGHRPVHEYEIERRLLAALVRVRRERGLT